MKVAVLTKRWFGGKETEVYRFESEKRSDKSEKDGNIASERSVLVITTYYFAAKHPTWRQSGFKVDIVWMCNFERRFNTEWGQSRSLGTYRSLDAWGAKT